MLIVDKDIENNTVAQAFPNVIYTSQKQQKTLRGDNGLYV